MGMHSQQSSLSRPCTLYNSNIRALITIMLHKCDTGERLTARAAPDTIVGLF